MRPSAVAYAHGDCLWSAKSPPLLQCAIGGLCPRPKLALSPPPVSPHASVALTAWFASKPSQKYV